MYTEKQFYKKLEQHKIFSSNQKERTSRCCVVCSDLLPNMQATDNSKIFVDYHNIAAIYMKDISKVILWGSLYNELTATALKFAVDNLFPIEIWENGFIRSVKGWNIKQNKYTNGYSFIKGVIPYFDTISEIKNNIKIDIETYKFTDVDIKLARKCIDFIVKNEITKYNHQPKIKLDDNIGKTKILVIDQSYNDMSIIRCGAGEQNFIDMVEKALAEPNAKLYLKLHPDTISGDRKGYFGLKEIQDLITKNKDRIELIDYEANPINLIKQVDKVYCVSSQLGFEAMMCNKDVKIFGNPIYNCKLTVEQFFYIFYIKNTVWIDPYSKQLTDIYSFLVNFNNFIGEYNGD